MVLQLFAGRVGSLIILQTTQAGGFCTTQSIDEGSPSIEQFILGQNGQRQIAGERLVSNDRRWPKQDRVHLWSNRLLVSDQV